LQVIGAGFGRTGTRSLQAALEIVGFGPCAHGATLIDDPRSIDRWREAARRRAQGQPVDWDVLLGPYQATVDWPAAHFWEDLAVAYPGAKVVLTVRDPDRWYDSARDTIYGPRRLRRASPLAGAAITLGGLAAPGPRRALRLADELIWDGLFGGRFEDRSHALAVFRRHVEAVTARLPPERLLVYDVREGWSPLCRFLGVDPPREPFPHLNDGAEFRRLVGRRLALGGLGFALLGAATVSGARRAAGFVEAARGGPLG